MRLLVCEVIPCAPCSKATSCSAGNTSLDSVLEKTGSNVVYELEAGEHCVCSYSPLVNLVNVTFHGLSPGNVTIQCISGNGLAFYNITDLSFTNIIIEGCGLNYTNVKHFLSILDASIDFFFGLSPNTDQYIAVVMANCSNLRMESTSISKTKGLGLLGINIIGQSSLNNVSIEENIPLGCFNTDVTNERVGGGLILSYHDYKLSNSNNVSSTLEITNSKFVGNSYCGYSAVRVSYLRYNESRGVENDLVVGGGGGLTVQLAQLQYSVNVSVRNSLFMNNTAIYGGGASMQFFTGVSNSHMDFDDCTFHSNGLNASFAYELRYLIGSALVIARDLVKSDFDVRRIRGDYTPSTLNIRNSMFLNNRGFTGTVVIYSLFNPILGQESQNLVVFDGCKFEFNEAVVGAGIFLQEWKYVPLQPGTNVLLKDVELIHNSLFRLSDIQSPNQNPGIIQASNINFTIAGNSSISHNIGTGLSSTSSSLYVQDNVTFLNNSGSYGGGIYMEGFSILNVGNESALFFINNSGTVLGGALFVSLYNNYISSPLDCFMYFGDIDLMYSGSGYTDITKLDTVVMFEGNHAPLGGMIYGSTLEGCPWAREFRNRYAQEMEDVNLLDILYQYSTTPFKFDSAPNKASFVSTGTMKITVEPPGLVEWNSSIPINVSPGLIRKLNITSFDGFERVVPTVITSISLNEDVRSEIGVNNYKFLDYNASGLTELKIYASPNISNVGVILFAVASYTQVQLNVTITNCPDGYIQVSSNNTCDCNHDLEKYFSVTCDDGELVIPFSVWVGRDPDQDLLLGTICSYDYCVPEIKVINPINSLAYDVQCDLNRSGIGCTKCAENLSLIFGSNSCKKCTNSHLWFLLLFSFYGIFLMFAIVFFQITISEGFLNGVLFFSNILSVYIPYFSPNSRINQFYLVFFWLSLKLGFETCFFDGMDALSVTGLHFVFPLYLYFLLFVIVLLSRWSWFSQRLFHREFSPTKLFGTIIVMTYSSLLESCIEVLSFSTLIAFSSDNKSTLYRWRYDLSQKYFHGFHGVLGTFSLLLLIFFLIPVPIIWMFPGKVLNNRKLQRYKPLYDAIWAPFKPKYRYWVSLRLLLRIIPLLIINFIGTPFNLLLLALYLLIILFVHGMVQPFQGKAQNGFDNFFQMILIFISLISFYFYFVVLNFSQNACYSDVEVAMHRNKVIAQVDIVQQVIVGIPVIISYLAFVTIIIWHLMLRFPKLQQLSIHAWNKVMCKRCQMKSSKSKPVIKKTDTSHASANLLDKPESGLKTTFSELREPLLETSGQADVWAVQSPQTL